ncbi:MAG: pilus assembly protein PilM [Myxococcota bacterium]
MPQRILGLDLGSWSIKAVLIETGFRGFQVERAVELPLPTPDPNLESPPSIRDRQALALAELLADDDLRADAQIIGFPGEEAAVRFLRLPFSDARKVEQIMEGELEDVVPFDLYEGVYDHQLLERNPIRGEPGNSLSLAVAARDDDVRSFLELLEQAEVDPKFLPVDVLGLYNLYSHFLAGDGTRPETPGLDREPALDMDELEVEEIDSARPEGRLLVDIGHARTLVLAASEAGIAHARVIRAGGEDVTRAIARTYNLEWSDAEAGKHADALIATARHPAANDEVQRLSDVIVRGLSPLVRELRRTLASVRRERRVDITRIDLLGGGARLENLPHYLAEALGVPVGMGAAVEQNVESIVVEDRRGAFAGALAQALRAGGDGSVNALDLRKGEFAFSGGLQHLRGRVPTMIAAVATLLVLLLAYGILKGRALGAREAEVDREFCRVTKDVVGREICEPDVALSVMRSPPSELGSFKLPETSALDILLELSERVPEDVKVKLTELNLTKERTVVEGEAPSFDAVDRLVAAYSESECLQDIQKDKLRKKVGGSGVEFQLKMKVGCS